MSAFLEASAEPADAGRRRQTVERNHRAVARQRGAPGEFRLDDSTRQEQAYDAREVTASAATLVRPLNSVTAKWEEKVRIHEKRPAMQLPDDMKRSILTEMTNRPLKDIW